MNEFITVEFLATFLGLATVTGFIVQFTKSPFKNKFGDGVVRPYAFIIALILTFTFARSGNDLQGIVLTLINAFIVAISAIGGYESITDPLAKKQK